MTNRHAKITIIGLILATLLSYSSMGFSEVSVNIGIGVPLPALVIPAPPAVVLIPLTYVYFVPDVEADIFFYHGYWYRPYHGVYYRATSYNGPWVSISVSSVPGAVIHVPPDFRRVPPGHQRISHAELKKNWKTWEKERHWDKQTYREQMTKVSGGGKGQSKQGKGGGKGKGKD